MGSAGLRAPAWADSVPFWGAVASVPIDTPTHQLKKGEFLWMGGAVTTARPGHPTPVGVFTVLQKLKEHRSTIGIRT